MKVSVQISRGIESLFGTHDENIRLLENGLNISTQLLNDSLELEGDEAAVARAETILQEYAELVREGHVFTNGDLNSYLRVVTEEMSAPYRQALKRLSRSPSRPRFMLAAYAPQAPETELPGWAEDAFAWVITQIGDSVVGELARQAGPLAGGDAPNRAGDRRHLRRRARQHP